MVCKNGMILVAEKTNPDRTKKEFIVPTIANFLNQSASIIIFVSSSSGTLSLVGRNCKHIRTYFLQYKKLSIDEGFCIPNLAEIKTTSACLVMEAPVKFFCLFGLIAIVSIAIGVDGAGECGKASPDNEAFKLAPCAEAAQDENAPVSDSCCLQVKSIGQNPSCLCAVMLSNTAKASGLKPGVAITIPKRCKLANRPVGYKCGG